MTERGARLRTDVRPRETGCMTDPVPEVLSQVLTWLDVRRPTRRYQHVLRARALEPDDVERTELPTRFVWLALSHDEIRFSARAEPSSRWPRPLVDPQGPPTIELDRPRACPHCACASTRYRRLGSGYLVCTACGCSTMPFDVLRAPSIDAGAAPIGVLRLSRRNLESRFGPGVVALAGRGRPAPARVWPMRLHDGQHVVLEQRDDSTEVRVHASPPDLARALRGLDLESVARASA